MIFFLCSLQLLGTHFFTNTTPLAPSSLHLVRIDELKIQTGDNFGKLLENFATFRWINVKQPDCSKNFRNVPVAARVHEIIRGVLKVELKSCRLADL